jgi:hypothetical protein
LISNTAIGTTSIQLVAPASALVSASPSDLLADAAAHVSQITLSQLTDSGGLPIPDGAKVALTAASSAATVGGAWVATVGGTILSAGTTPGDGDVAPNNDKFRVFTVAGGQVQAVYSATGLSADVDETKVARVAVVPASSTGNTLTNAAIGVGVINLHGTSTATPSGPVSLHLSGESATVTFGGIKDSAGNLVPDGTLVAVTAAGSVTTSGGSWVASSGGTIVDGVAASDARFHLFPVVNGSVTVTYSTAGASGGIARVQVIPARIDGTLIGSRVLNGGVWAITVTQ